MHHLVAFHLEPGADIVCIRGNYHIKHVVTCEKTRCAAEKTSHVSIYTNVHKNMRRYSLLLRDPLPTSPQHGKGRELRDLVFGGVLGS